MNTNSSPTSDQLTTNSPLTPATGGDNMAAIVEDTLKSIIGGTLPPKGTPIALPEDIVRAMIKKSLIFDCMAKLVVRRRRGEAIRILDSLPFRKDLK